MNSELKGVLAQVLALAKALNWNLETVWWVHLFLYCPTNKGVHNCTIKNYNKHCWKNITVFLVFLMKKYKNKVPPFKENLCIHNWLNIIYFR